MAIGAASVVVAVLLGAVIGPAGPDWWRVPLELLDRLPFVSIDSGMTDNEWTIVWDIRFPRVILGGIVGGDALPRRSQLPRCVPQPVGRPVPPRRGRRRRPRRHAGVHRAAHGDGRLAGRSGSCDGLRCRDRHRLPDLRRRCERSAASRTGLMLVLAGVAVTSLATAVQAFLLQRNVGRRPRGVLVDPGTALAGRLGRRPSHPAVRRDRRRRAAAAPPACSTCCESAKTRPSTLGAPVARRAPRRRRGGDRWRPPPSVSVSGLIGFVGIIVPHAVRLARWVGVPACSCR